MNIASTITATLFTAALALGPAAAEGLAQDRPYRVDPAASTLTIEVAKAGYLSSLGHDHVITAADVSGFVHCDPQAPTRGASVRFEVPAAKLRVADPGIDGEKRAEIQGNMEREVLEVTDFPTIAFRSSAIEGYAGEPDKLRVAGDLMLHGATRPISFIVTLERAPDGSLVVTGSTRLKQTDFGIEPFSAALGAVGCADEVGVKFSIRAVPQQEKGKS